MVEKIVNQIRNQIIDHQHYVQILWIKNASEREDPTKDCQRNFLPKINYQQSR